jgi:hypothetical protein
MATRSKSALLPMQLERNSQGQWVWNAEIPVESDVLRYLVNDAGNGVLGPVTAGTATTLQNSQCVLNAASSSTSGAGTQLTVFAALSFKPAFAGAKNIYMHATDSANQTFALVAKGIFVVN